MLLSPPTRTCNKCGEPFPLEEFRRRRKGGTEREGDCRDCHNKALRRRRDRHRVRRLRLDVRCLCSAGERPDKIRAIVTAMLSRFGGVHRLTELWYSSLQLAAEHRPGSAYAVQSMQAILRMLTLLESQEREQNAQRELPAEFIDQLRGVVRDDPKGLAEQLRAMGFGVTMPWEQPEDSDAA